MRGGGGGKIERERKGEKRGREGDRQECREGEGRGREEGGVRVERNTESEKRMEGGGEEC